MHYDELGEMKSIKSMTLREKSMTLEKETK